VKQVQVFKGRNPHGGRSLEVCVEDGIIRAIEPGKEDDDAWLSAGFIDLQINGYGGDDVNVEDLDPETIVSLAGKVVATGVTTFFPTVITSSEERITAALRAIATARKRSRLVANVVPWIHVEGPYISAVDGFRGAHPEEHVRPPSLPEFDRWQEASGGLVKMITLSPHFEGVEVYIAHVTARGTHVSLGHTDATPEQVRKAVDAGARLSTHLGNGTPTTLPRHPNVVWTQLAEDRLTATLIADSQHLPTETLKAIMRAKGVNRSILVSDTVALAGMPPGIYETPVGGRVELQESGRLSLAGTDYLAGAVVPLKDGVASAAKLMDGGLGDAVRMATENPGRFADGRGVLRVGERADLVRFTMDATGGGLRIKTVVVAGKEWG
jgi:N-acetylglucosamine-6-phosphate deacetylase